MLAQGGGRKQVLRPSSRPLLSSLRRFHKPSATNSANPSITYLDHWLEIKAFQTACQIIFFGYFEVRFMPDEFIVSFSVLWAQVPASRCTATCGLVTGGSLVSRLDGEPTTILLNGTTFAGGIMPVYLADKYARRRSPAYGSTDEGDFRCRVLRVRVWPCSTVTRIVP